MQGIKSLRICSVFAVHAAENGLEVKGDPLTIPSGEGLYRKPLHILGQNAKEKSMKKISVRKKTSVDELTKIMPEQSRKDIPSDVLGSYTGTPLDEEDEPVQDADDL